MIRASNLSFVYPNGIKVLEQVSFQIQRGEFVALIGQNGAGKTTLLKQLNGLLKPTAGDLFIDGINTKDSSTGELAQKVGYLFQNPDHQIFLPSVEKEIGFGPSNLHLSKAEVKERVQNAAEQVGLIPYLKENPLFLSKGQRQRVAFASLLSMQPEVMVLDEPTTGQDYQEGIEIMEMVKELHQKGHTIVFVTHDMELVAGYAQRVIVLNQGQVLVDDVCRDVFYQPDLLLKTNLFPSQIARLVQKFGNRSNPFGRPLTVKELYDQVLTIMESGSNVCCS
jgi:energy-coupling factor transport system ATP-binding protein